MLISNIMILIWSAAENLYQVYQEIQETLTPGLSSEILTAVVSAFEFSAWTIKVFPVLAKSLIYLQSS